MVEGLKERKSEPEPKETTYDISTRLQNEAVRRRAEGRVIIKGKERGWEQGRQGLLKYLQRQADWETVGAPGWKVFINQIKQHSGRHTHQGGLVLFALEGKGYTIVDGVRNDWEEGDLIVLPIKPGGCEHQHFNQDPQKPAMWMAFLFQPTLDVVSIGRTQQAEHPDWAGGREK